jgi:hypothetical protein
MNSIVAVSPFDLGSREDESGERIVASYPNITIQDLEESLDLRNLKNYNEWVVRHYEVIGIFAIEPLNVGLPSSIGGFRRACLREVFEAFPRVPIFTFNQSFIVKLNIDGQAETQPAHVYDED